MNVVMIIPTGIGRRDDHGDAGGGPPFDRA